jgi:hypothetical protein
MSNIQDYFVDREFWFNELVNDELSDDFLNDELNVLIDKIIDDKCDDEIVTHVLSQFKEKYVVNAFFVMMSWFSTMNILNLYVIEHKSFN